MDGARPEFPAPTASQVVGSCRVLRGRATLVRPQSRSRKRDGGTMWPTYFALKELSAAEEAKIVRLVKKAVS